MAEIAILTSAFVMSVLSGLVPFVNAEVLVAGAAVAAPTALVAPVIVACSAGQIVAKVGLYAGARWLPERLPAKARKRLEAASQKTKRLEGAGFTLVLVSAVVGLPPFYLISLAAGALRMSLTWFIIVGLVGRGVRFAVIGYSAVAAGSAIHGAL